MLVISGIMPFTIDITTTLIMFGSKYKTNNITKKADVSSKFVFKDLNALFISSRILFLSKSEGKVSSKFPKKSCMPMQGEASVRWLVLEFESNLPEFVEENFEWLAEGFRYAVEISSFIEPVPEGQLLHESNSWMGTIDTSLGGFTEITFKNGCTVT